MLGKFEVVREPRENHPWNSKAVLYAFEGGEKIKVGVWKPGRTEPKLAVASVPNNVLEALHDECLAIEAEEKASGVADY